MVLQIKEGVSLLEKIRQSVEESVMRVYKTLEGTSLPEKLVVALGNFDGVHLGHRRL